MSKSVAPVLLIVIGIVCATTDAHADVYKCVGADGAVTFSQTPCPGEDVSIISRSVSTHSGDDTDCTHASRFALATAKTMRDGASSAELFSRYGGLDSLSKGTINIINYVYGYRANKDVSVERVAALTQAKCRARSLGDVSCGALPFTYTEQLGGCDATSKEAEATSVASEQFAAPLPALREAEEAQRASSDAQLSFDVASKARAEQQRQQCRHSTQRSIDNINAQMRGGYSSEQGERYRVRLRELREQLRDC